MRVKRGSVSRGKSRGIFPDSKGQVTIFIIVGILLLFAFAGIMYFTKTFTKETVTVEGEPVIEDVPQAFKPISSYTESCLNQIGKRGLLILGEQGGYVYPDLVGEYSASDPTNADGIDLEPLKSPYWHYNVKPNEVNEISFASLKPKLYVKDDPVMSVEAQLSRFVEEKLDGCLDGYSPFLNQGFEIEILGGEDTKKVTATVGENTVNFLLEMRIKAKKGAAESEMGQFYIKVPLRLKHYYEVASQVAGMETNHSFLELQALDLIAAYSAVEQDKLPPTEAVIFDLIPTVYWTEADVKEKFKGLLVSSVPLLRYLGSDNFYRYEYQPTSGAVVDLSQLHQKNYDNMIVPLDFGEKVKVNFDYFGWPVYFDLNDKGGKVEPSSYYVDPDFFKLPFNSHHYYTTYDVSYPVLITISDSAALGGESYNFVFALEANIRNNELVESEDVLPPPIATVGKSMVCDEDKRSTEIIKSIVVDSYSKESLEAVQIGFSVPDQDDCIMGQTNFTGEFESSYPAVYGGVGSYMKEEYLTNFYPLDTYEFKDQPGIIGYAVAGLPENVVELHRFKQINVRVKKKSLEKCVGNNCYTQGLFGSVEEPLMTYKPELLDKTHSWVFVDAAKSLDEKETATIILKRVADLNAGVFSDEFTTTVAIAGDNTAEMELVPGIYEVNALLTSEEELVIPKEERCTGGIVEALACWDIDGCCFTFDENVLDQSLTGQLLWDESGKYLAITPEQLYGSDELTFYILDFNLAGVPKQEHLRVLEDLQVMGQLGNFSKILQGDLEPTFS